MSKDPPQPGLRERKKARTRALIQERALRLFAANGYDATSVEEIAAAAEVSPSTVFRYFPTKPDLVIYDDLDDRVIAAFRAQPRARNAVQALRGAFRTVFVGLAATDLALQRERTELMSSIPELRGAMLDELARTVREIAVLVAERSGRAEDDDEVLALSGAVMGLSIAAWFGGGSDWADRMVDRIDHGMALLEVGFTL